MDWLSGCGSTCGGAVRVWSIGSPEIGLEQVVHLLKHLFDALLDVVALLGECVDSGLGLRGYEGLEFELFAKLCVLGLGLGAGFALLLYDFDCTQNLLFEGLELVNADGGCAHCYNSCEEYRCYARGYCGWGTFLGDPFFSESASQRVSES